MVRGIAHNRIKLHKVCNVTSVIRFSVHVNESNTLKPQPAQHGKLCHDIYTIFRQKKIVYVWETVWRGCVSHLQSCYTQTIQTPEVPVANTNWSIELIQCNSYDICTVIYEFHLAPIWIPIYEWYIQSHSLYHPPIYPTKPFGFVLSARCSVSFRTLYVSDSCRK